MNDRPAAYDSCGEALVAMSIPVLIGLALWLLLYQLVRSTLLQVRE